MDTTLTPTLIPSITKIATTAAKIASNSAQTTPSININLWPLILGLVVGWILYTLIKFLNENFEEIFKGVHPGATCIISYPSYKWDGLQVTVLQKDYSGYYYVILPPCECTDAEKKEAMELTRKASLYIGNSYPNPYVCPKCYRDRKVSINGKYLIPLSKSKEIVTHKKGGAHMPRAIRWSLWFAIVILVYKFVGNAEIIANSVAKHWLHL